LVPGPRPSLFQATALPVSELGDADRLACLRLIRSDNVGPVTFRDLLGHFGCPHTALAALPELSRRGGRPIRACSAEAAEAELERAHRTGALPMFAVEPGYPAALAALDAPPPMLYAKGKRDLLARPTVAIVGSRQCSAAGDKITRRFAYAIGQAGYVIVSGLARGIDATAHKSALSSGTIAVLAGGIDIVYPPEHAALQETIGTEGCLVTEMPPGFVPRGQDFPRRNRIISGLALGVLVVEAARRSGSLVTARLAAEQGREVFAIPGHPLDPRAEGTNRLLKSGATLVTEPEDILSALAPLTQAPARPVSDAQEPPPADYASDPQTASPSQRDRDQIVAALGPAPIDIDALVRSTGLTARTVQIVLIELALAGRIERHGGGLVSLVPDRP
jgi:DNA processing protein